MNYWINTISLDHVQRGVAGGFTQAGHGKAAGLKRLKKGDWIIFYSPKMSYPDGASLQQFTAIGQVSDEEPYQVDMSSDFHPYRRNVDFKKCQPVPIRPLLDELGFIRDKQHWGYAFRFGLFQIAEADFRLLQAALTNVG